MAEEMSNVEAARSGKNPAPVPEEEELGYIELAECIERVMSRNPVPPPATT